MVIDKHLHNVKYINTYTKTTFFIKNHYSILFKDHILNL